MFRMIRSDLHVLVRQYPSSAYKYLHSQFRTAAAASAPGTADTDNSLPSEDLWQVSDDSIGGGDV